MKLKRVLCVGISSLCCFYASSVVAHGWVDYPMARQSICEKDGGYWSTGGNAIPNAACKGAYDMSGTYAFVQKNEVAINVADYRNMEAVRRAVPDGLLCSAGSPSKSGLDRPSAAWQKTVVETDAEGKFQMRFNASAPHNPSHWQFYLTKPGFDAGRDKVSWGNLELIQSTGNVPVQNGYYYIDVKLPMNREGDALLYTRWQRDDTAGEGFYNCSDITIDHSGKGGSSVVAGGGTSKPDPGDNGLQGLGEFVNKSYASAELRDVIRFRYFIAGTLKADERLELTEGNHEIFNWAQLLASNINRKHGDTLVVGTPDYDGSYSFDTADLYGNQVWSKVAGVSYSLSIIKASDPEPPKTDTSSTWDAAKVYNEGDTVVHGGINWRAGWWTQGDEPGTTGKWGVWRQP